MATKTLTDRFRDIIDSGTELKIRYEEIKIRIAEGVFEATTKSLEEGGKVLKADVATMMSIAYQTLKSKTSIEEAMLAYIEKQPYGSRLTWSVLTRYREIIDELAYKMWEEGGRQQNKALDYWLAAQKAFLQMLFSTVLPKVPVREGANNNLKADAR
jgi:hypothetical protein